MSNKGGEIMFELCMAMIDNEEDKTVFKKLYEKYVNLMLYTAYQILGNQEDAEDAVSEAFLRIAKNFSRFEKKICPKTANQFVIIVRNISIDIYRKNKKKTEIPFEEDIDINIKTFDENEPSEIEEALSRLSQNEKDILYMYYIYDTPIKDISKLFEISEAAAYKRIQRAKSSLKKILETDNLETDKLEV